MNLRQYISLLIFFISTSSLCIAQAENIAPASDQNNITPQTEEKPYGIFDMFDGNPGKSALYSLLIPGAGQLYNKRYWKAPIVWAVEGYFVYNLIQSIEEYRFHNQLWETLIELGPTQYHGETINATGYKTFRDSARQSMEFAYLTLAIVHIVNIADAFVDRHLIEFDVKDDIGFHIVPDKYSAGIGIVITF